MSKRLILVAAIFLFSFSYYHAAASAFSGKKGAEVVVTFSKGMSIQGELLAVCGEWLVLASPETGEEQAFDITRVLHIRIKGKQKILNGALAGLAIGAGTVLLLSDWSTPDHNDRLYLPCNHAQCQAGSSGRL